MIKILIFAGLMVISSAFAATPKDIDAKIEVCKYSFVRTSAMTNDSSLKRDLRQEYLNLTDFQVTSHLILLNEHELDMIQKEIDKLTWYDLKKLAIRCADFSNSLK